MISSTLPEFPEDHKIIFIISWPQVVVLVEEKMQVVVQDMNIVREEIPGEKFAFSLQNHGQKFNSLVSSFNYAGAVILLNMK